MCGRFTVSGANEMAEDDILAPVEMASQDLKEEILRPRYNVAPTQPIPVLRDRGEKRMIGLMRWGLVPGFSREVGGRPLINARSETVIERPSFAPSFKKRRCLVPGNGFFEWPRINGKKKKGTAPYLFRMRGGQTFAFAGIWSSWKPKQGSVLEHVPKEVTRHDRLMSCSILTTTPNNCVAEFHDRMPVILLPEHYRMWLDQEVEPEALLELLRPLDDELMERYAVSADVNKVDNDSPELIERAPEEPRNLSLF